MTTKVIVKSFLLGFLSWAIPFAVSFLFYNSSGELNIPYATFKSIMIATGTISGCYLLFRYFRLIDSDFVRNGVIVGLSWFALNILLDSVILIPMMKTTFSNYFLSIGLGYMAIPAISIAMGYLLKAKTK